MTFEEWFVSSGWFGFGSAVEMAANDGYEAGYKQAIIDCYGEAAAPLVLESLKKASNRPVEQFSSGGEGQGSQTPVQPCQGGCPQLCRGCPRA